MRFRLRPAIRSLVAIMLLVVVSLAANSSLATPPMNVLPPGVQYPQVQACAFLSNDVICTSIPSVRSDPNTGSNVVLRCWEVKTGNETDPFGAKPRTGSSGLAVSRDGKYLAASGDGNLNVWDLTKPFPYQTVATLKSVGSAFDFIGDSAKIATADLEKLRVFAVPSTVAAAEFPLSAENQRTMWLDVSPDGKLVVAQNIVYDLKKQREFAVIEPSEMLYAPPVFSPDSKYLAYVTLKELTVWDVANRKPSLQRTYRLTLTETEKALNFREIDTPGPILWTPDGKGLLIRTKANQLHTVDRKTGDLKQRIFSDNFIAQCYAYSPDGQHLAAGGWGEIRIKNLKTDKVTTIKLDPFPKRDAGK
ncbi:MAG: WD40 repeat domain-containing protein [Planctomycetota bacterium]|nr:WD40 repeat domain-containing protein [Planctomycetota bacterium]